jgi:hypothetical protein
MIQTLLEARADPSALDVDGQDAYAHLPLRQPSNAEARDAAERLLKDAEQKLRG